MPSFSHKAWRPVRSLRLVMLTLLAGAVSAAPPKGAYDRPQVPIVPAELIPPSPPLSAEEELKTFHLARGSASNSLPAIR